MQRWRRIAAYGITAAAVGTAATSNAQEVPAMVEKQLPDLLMTYKSIHAAPELSHHEAATSALLASELRKVGYTVTERVGKYSDGSQAYGVVAILKNGAGPTLLVRTDLDALPVTEKTSLPYASSVRSKNPAGQDVGVMHACGHDIHITTMIGVARNMAALKSQWHGRLMLIGQPSEETIDGAKAMLADHLYERFGQPDLAIALHDANFAAGKVSVVSGPALASSTSIDVVMRGVGSHGAAPEAGKDPIVMASEFVVAAQTIVSRSIPPDQPAVVTVGDIHGGTKRNIIPDEVKLELTTRCYSEAVRQTIIEGVRRTAKGIAIAGGVPDDRTPIVTVLEGESTPATVNDPALAARLQKIFVAKLGAENVIERKPIMGSEDFGIFSLDHKIPAVIFWLGAYDSAKVAESERTGVALPSPHSPFFAPLPEPTLRTGVAAMTDAAVALLQ
ncbi:amidohydrolase [Tunturiibacter gelidoferens]|uniref:Hippurate hydrolase n=1 Tax=Tunturiibacter gelidiferens TaxID=3069689 RepID=A0ACC5NWR4_9BACT|nr:amidohydrolase [Edaphobacter lichenicola]MBB5339038.1 hippurate hydrolase [Edaphobacter lichenicola]